MPRNACIRHPKDKVIEIPIGAKYCERCNHLVLPEPELEIVAIVREMALEEESEPVTKEEYNEAVDEHNAEVDEFNAKVDAEATETPVEAEPEPSVVEFTEEAVEEAAKAAIDVLDGKIKEVTVEAEPELIIDPVPLHTGSANTPSQKFTRQPLEAIPPDTVEEAKRRVKIAELYAKLAELEKTE